ncbi:hypothetical protein MASR2M36_10240 [Providencia sp.]
MIKASQQMTAISDGVQIGERIVTQGIFLIDSEAEYMVRASGYFQSIDDFNKIYLKTSESNIPIYLRDVARIQEGPEMRRGVAELNGERGGWRDYCTVFR